MSLHRPLKLEVLSQSRSNLGARAGGSIDPFAALSFLFRPSRPPTKRDSEASPVAAPDPSHDGRQSLEADIYPFHPRCTRHVRLGGGLWRSEIASDIPVSLAKRISSSATRRSERQNTKHY